MRSPARRLKFLGSFLISCGLLPVLLNAVIAWKLRLPRYTWVTSDGLILSGLFAGVGVLALASGVLEDRTHKRRDARRCHGRCMNCGYSLTGLPERRCPECGQPFEPRGDAP